MKLYIYANYMTTGGFFSSPITNNLEPSDLAKDYLQVIYHLSKEVLNSLKECDLYCLGVYDNVSGSITPMKEFVLHCGEFVNKILKDEISSNSENSLKED